MSYRQFKNLKKVAASFVCIAGMLASSAALADGGKSQRVKLTDLGAKRFYDGDVYIWGDLYGYSSYKRKLEVQVRARVRVKDICINPGGKVVYGHSSDHVLTIWDYKRIGSIYGHESFHLDLDINNRLGYYHHCPNHNWRSKRIVEVERVHVRVLRGYGYGYGYDYDYDCHHQGYDCGSGYHGYDPDYGYEYGYGYGYGYDQGWYGYDDHDHGYGYGVGYGDGDYGYSYGDYGHSYYGSGYEYGYDEPGYDTYAYGYVLAMGDCWFKRYSKVAYCDLHH